MKILYSIFFLLVFLLPARSQTHLKFTFNNAQYQVSQYTNVMVILQPEQLNTSGSVTIMQPRVYGTTDTNGSVTFSNLSGSYTGGYYHWIVPARTSPDGFNPPVISQGDVQITSTNLGLIDSTTVGIAFVPVYSGFGASWTAQASDLRYASITNSGGGGTTLTNLSGFTSGDPTNNVLSDAGTNTVNAVINQNLSTNTVPEAIHAATADSATSVTGAQADKIANGVTNEQPNVVLKNTFTFLPVSSGASQFFLDVNEMGIYDTNGNKSASIGYDGVFSGNGSGLTDLNAEQLTGTISPTNLPASVVTNVYNVKQFGAYGDAKFVSWVYASSNSVILNSPYGQFASSDIGSTICISGGMTNDGFFVTGISNVISSTQIILSNAPQQNVTNSLGQPFAGQGSYAVYGKHDDTPAFQAAADQVTNGNARVFIPSGNYLLLGALKRTNDNNAQIVVPVPNANVSLTNFYAQSIPTLEIFGESEAWFWGSVNGRDSWFKPQPNTTLLISPIMANGYLTNGMGASVIDGRAYNSGNAASYIYSSVGQNGWSYPDNPCRLVMHDMTVMTSYNSGMTAINSMGFAQGGFWNMAITRNQLRPESKVYAPYDTNSYGIILNGQYNGGDTKFDQMYVSGYYNGVDIGLMKGRELVIEGCVKGITLHYTGAIQAACDGIDFSSCLIAVDAAQGKQAQSSWIEFSRVMFEGSTNQVIGVDSFGNSVTNNFGLWSLTNCITVNDPSNYLRGYFNYSYKNSGQPSSGLGLHKIGATNLNVTVETFNGLTHESAEQFTNSGNTFVGTFYNPDGTPLSGSTNVFYLYPGESVYGLTGFTGVTPVRAFNLGFNNFLGNQQITIPFPNNGNIGAWNLPLDKINGKTHLDFYLYGSATNVLGQTNSISVNCYLSRSQAVGLESPNNGFSMNWSPGETNHVQLSSSYTLSGAYTYAAGTLTLYCNSTNGGLSVLTLIRGEAY